MTPEQTQKLKEALKKVPTELLRKEIQRRHDAARHTNSKMCQACKDNGKRIPKCPTCYERHKIECRNRERIKRGIPIDAPLQTRAKLKISIERELMNENMTSDALAMRLGKTKQECDATLNQMRIEGTVTLDVKESGVTIWKKKH